MKLHNKILLRGALLSTALFPLLTLTSCSDDASPSAKASYEPELNDIVVALNDNDFTALEVKTSLTAITVGGVTLPQDFVCLKISNFYASGKELNQVSLASFSIDPALEPPYVAADAPRGVGPGEVYFSEDQIVLQFTVPNVNAEPGGAVTSVTYQLFFYYQIDGDSYTFTPDDAVMFIGSSSGPNFLRVEGTVTSKFY